ncbi:MAG: hypothetical protein DPW18_07560 [Chloroflexi bacterium]|nr:hypothetical protein [Chloroflexota bacterium]MDL1941521.1 SDR family NAD(P)-dependent oxidoreductase [Chloroflexi bacterium CFX2]
MFTTFITGANRGIGLAFTREYLARGGRVFAACRAPAEAARLHPLKTTYGGRLTLVPLDVTDSKSIEAAAEQVQRETDALDLLINNAGVFFPSAGFADLNPESLGQSFAVNSTAPMMVSQKLMPLLQKSASPKIVNITAPTRPIAQLQRTENHSYTASRYALNAMTKMLSLELRSLGVIVVALWPGYLRTDMNNMAGDAAPPEEAIPQVVNLIQSLNWEHTGCCLLPDGKIFDW